MRSRITFVTVWPTRMGTIWASSGRMEFPKRCSARAGSTPSRGGARHAVHVGVCSSLEGARWLHQRFPYAPLTRREPNDGASRGPGEAGITLPGAFGPVGLEGIVAYRVINPAA